MGRVKEWMVQEQIIRQEAVESMPDHIEDALIQIRQLHEKVEQSNATIHELESKLSAANSFKAKMRDYVIGGIIGAVIGIVLSAIFL